MWQAIEKSIIKTLYEKYKREYNRHNMISIVPKVINDSSSTDMAYTNNEELKHCISSGTSVTLCYNKKLFSCSRKYIRSVLYHEYTHIYDCYEFYNLDYSNLLMSTYSEFHAMRVEFLIKSNNKTIMIDDEICDENGVTTPRKEIEGYLNDILKNSKAAHKHPEQVQKKMPELTPFMIKSLSWMLAYLSFFEISETQYFQNCFERMGKYKPKVEALYSKMQNLDDTKNNPTDLALLTTDLVGMCFGC